MAKTRRGDALEKKKRRRKRRRERAEARTSKVAEAGGIGKALGLPFILLMAVVGLALWFFMR